MPMTAINPYSFRLLKRMDLPEIPMYKINTRAAKTDRKNIMSFGGRIMILGKIEMMPIKTVDKFMSMRLLPDSFMSVEGNSPYSFGTACDIQTVLNTTGCDFSYTGTGHDTFSITYQVPGF